MHPPSDPWESPIEPIVPQTPTPMYGRAPVPPPPVRQPTSEYLPVVPVRQAHAGRPLSYQRASRASLRSLADGWGFSATGLIVAFAGWGLYAVAGRGRLHMPFVGFLVTVTVAVGLFAVSRWLGYVVLGRLLHRPRPHARWAHSITGLFLAAAGVSYLVQTSWMVDGSGWLSDGWR